MYLKQHLHSDLDKYKHTKTLRMELYSSLERRFSDLLKDNDIFILSTILDPFFAKKRIPKDLRDFAVAKLKVKLIQISTRRDEAKTSTIVSNNSSADTNRDNNYLCFEEDVESMAPLDELDNQINEYFLLTQGQEFNDALLFWKLYHKSPKFFNLAKLAQKLLGVPATSASVERIFSLSGHILGPKRRTTGVSLYEDLVFLNLNEELLE
jgi:hypothetical protein